MARNAKDGNTAVARRGVNAATCYATLGANRVRAIYEGAVALIAEKDDPIGVIRREFKAEAEKGKGTQFLAYLHSVLDAVAARSAPSQGINGNDIKGLMVAAMKQAGDAAPGELVTVEARVIEGDRVQPGYSDKQDTEW